MALHFELVTPEKLVRSAEVYQVVVPGTDGDFGVLEGHAPFMSTVRDGAIQVFTSAGAAPEMIPVEGGFAEVNEKGLTVLAEKAAEPPIPIARQGPPSIRRRGLFLVSGSLTWHS